MKIRYESEVQNIKVIKKSYIDWKEKIGTPPRTCAIQEYEYIMQCEMKSSSPVEKEYTYWVYVIRNAKVGNGEAYMEIARLDSAVAQLWEAVPNSIEAPEMTTKHFDLFHHMVETLITMGQTNVVMKFCTPPKSVIQDYDDEDDWV